MFAAAFKKFNQAEISYQEIKEILTSTLSSSPDMLDSITELLNDNSESVLTVTQRQELLTLVAGISHADDDGKTKFNPGESSLAEDSDDSTIINVQDNDATVLAEQSTAVSADATDASTENNETKQLKPGDTIKGRFVLEKLIGQGGMGMVFKARDLRKEEAMDSNPYVAVKVLGGTFKDHPQALIALQRESRKAQTLAHPNIVTVYDFDRDGDIAYMTMEYLEGDSLDQVIKKQYPTPFTKEQALRIIDGICQGLAYAHSHNIIHADLKPGNVYVTNSNTVKIFDFGIARAMTKKEGEQNVDSLTGETTLFDAGDLGGLTPAYASYEMLTGEDPDTRDDIYALACIAFELLAGKHPFNKVPAKRAQEQKLVPPPVANISRQQFRGLERGLSFVRKQRTATVSLFRDDLCRTKTISKSLLAAGIATSIAIAFIISIPIINYLDNKEVTAIVEKLNSSDEKTVLATLDMIKTLQPDIQKSALKDGKDAIIKYYEQKANNAIDASRGKFNFESANNLLDEAATLYEDSAQLKDIRSRIERQKNTLLSELTQRFNQHIDAENLLVNPAEDDLLDTLAEIAKIDSQHELLHDARISFAYVQAAEKQAKAKNIARADQLIATGLVLLPEDRSLINMQHAIEAAKANTGGIASQLAALQRSLEKSITPEQRKLSIEALLKNPFNNRQWSKTLAAQFKTLKTKIPNNDSWIKEYSSLIQKIYLNQAVKMRKASRFAEAKNALAMVRTITAANKSITREEKHLASAKKKYDKERKKKAQLAKIDGLKKTLLAQARANDVKSAKKNFQKLKKALPAKDKFLTTDAPGAIADAYLKLAQISARRGAYGSAVKLINSGLRFSPKHTMLLTSLTNYQRKAPKTRSRTVSKSNDPCKANFAGHGKRSRATCHDVLAKKTNGPTMIVIPAGASLPDPYAISKYEISIADYNNYCKLSKQCKTKPGKSNLPISGIAFTDAKKYSQWLSKKSGFQYKIPSDTEWFHASNSGGKQPSKNFNCQVSLGGNLIKGLSLINTRSGKSNRWGLTNYIGNVQEWVLTNSSKLMVRGGSFKDPLSVCDVKLSRSHNGRADNITGFRLVRKLKR